MSAGTLLSYEEELEIMDLLNQGMSAAKVAKKLDRSMSAVKRLKKKVGEGYTPKEAPKSATEMGADFSTEESLFSSYRNAVFLLERVLEDAKDGYEIVEGEGERTRRVPLKTIIESLEKAGNFFVKMKSKAKGGKGNVKVDYNKMAKLYGDAKKKDEYYDSKRHMRDLLNCIKDVKGEL